MKRGLQVTIGLSVLVLLGCGLPLALQERDEDSCEAAVAAAREHVYTAHRWTEADLPGIGDYLDVHYHLTGNPGPCRRGVPEPDHWGFQGLLRLRPADGAALAAAYDWAPLDDDRQFPYGSPARMWPGLAPFAPREPGWSHSPAYARTVAAGDLFLSADRSTAYFVLDPDRPVRSR